MKIYSASKSGEDAFVMPFKSYIKAINHRGYNRVAPENTLPAFRLSAQKGFRYVETDVSFTAPDTDNPLGVPMLLHNATIDDTSNGTGTLSEMTFQQVRQYDFGSWKSSAYTGTKIPSLEEFMILCRNLGLHPYLEIKNGIVWSKKDEYIQKICNIVDRYGMRGNVSYIGYDEPYLQEVKACDPYARLVKICDNIDATQIQKVQGLQLATNEVVLSSGNLTSATIEMCKDANVKLETWKTIKTNTDAVEKQRVANLDDYISGVTHDFLNAEYIKYEKSLTYPNY